MILKAAPMYIELKTIYSIVRPKIIRLHYDGKIDDETFELLKRIDDGLPKVDELAQIFYNNAIEDKSELSESEIKLINNTIHDITSLLLKALPLLLV